MKIKMVYASCLLCAIALLATSGNLSAKDTFTMKFATFSAAQKNHPSYTPYEIFVKEVEKNSDGRIEVKFFPGGQLGSPESAFLQAKRGIIQGTEGSEGVISPQYNNISIFSIPYFFLSRDIAWKFLDSEFVEKNINDDFAAKTGLRPLAWLENGGFRHFSNNIRPVKSPEDMKGLKIRVMNSPVYVNIVKSLGASPTPIAWAELYTSLQTGVVDGQENAIPTFLFAKLQEVQKYLILDGHVYSFSSLLINEKFFQSLPEDLKKVVRDAAAAAAKSSRELLVMKEKEGLDYLKNETDVEVYDPTIEEKAAFRDLAQPGATEWVMQNISNPELVEKALKAVKQFK